MNFVEELQWRGMVHTIMPGTKEQLDRETTTAYLGIDPTADSLHIGHLVGVMMLKHFQASGHRPIALLGGATGMIGDPSMKSAERNLLDEATLRHNQECIQRQLARFLDFESDAPNRAILVNNYDWMGGYGFLAFIRDIGKHITVNYMMAKDSVRKRLERDASEGMSFTEFSYQLVQGYDFLHLYEAYNCKLQLGGSDQWGNITTGTELIRRKRGGEAYALTCPLLTKADGGKFGKTESGNIWLDPRRTSPYAFYQFWLNTSDADAERYLKIFTMLPREAIQQLADEHSADPGRRVMQRQLAESITRMVHGQEALDSAIEASQILFGRGTTETLRHMDEATLLSVFEGVPTFNIPRADIDRGIALSELLTSRAAVFPSKSELRRNVAGIQINKEKVNNAEVIIDTTALLNGKYILVQKGKKNYYLFVVA